jgi:lysophospholipase L1-like esterase
VRAPSGELQYFFEPKPDITYGSELEKPSWVSYKYSYTINKDSLNERFNYSVEKPSNVFRIVILGDSFTFGVYVNTKDNWTEILEDMLNDTQSCIKNKKYEVINLGVRGYDAAYEVERYIKRGMKYNPDLLIMLIIDYRRMTEYRRAQIKNFSVEEIEEMKKEGIVDPHSTEDSRLDDSVRIAYQYPQYERLFNNFSRNILIVDHEKKKKELSFFEELGNKYPRLFYTQTTFPIREKSTSLSDGHPNTEGHKKIAQDVFDYLTNSNLIICK